MRNSILAVFYLCYYLITFIFLIFLHCGEKVKRIFDMREHHRHNDDHSTTQHSLIDGLNEVNLQPSSG